jgi:hypothetical protein
MLIPEVSQIGERTPNAGRWVAAARASRRSTTPPAQAPAELAEVNAGADVGEDDISDWGPRQDMTLAGVQAAYESI